MTRVENRGALQSLMNEKENQKQGKKSHTQLIKNLPASPDTSLLTLYNVENNHNRNSNIHYW